MSEAAGVSTGNSAGGGGLGARAAAGRRPANEALLSLRVSVPVPRISQVVHSITDFTLTV